MRMVLGDTEEARRIPEATIASALPCRFRAVPLRNAPPKPRRWLLQQAAQRFDFR